MMKDIEILIQIDTITLIKKDKVTHSFNIDRNVYVVKTLLHLEPLLTSLNKEIFIDGIANVDETIKYLSTELPSLVATHSEYLLDLDKLIVNLKVSGKETFKFLVQITYLKLKD